MMTIMPPFISLQFHRSVFCRPVLAAVDDPLTASALMAYPGSAQWRSLVSGYGIGVLLSAVYRYLELPEPAAAHKVWIRRVVAAAFALSLCWFIYSAAAWNQQVIDIVGATRDNAYSVKFTVVALLVGWSVLAIARQVRRLFRANIDFSLKKLPQSSRCRSGSRSD